MKRLNHFNRVCGLLRRVSGDLILREQSYFVYFKIKKLNIFLKLILLHKILFIGRSNIFCDKRVHIEPKVDQLAVLIEIGLMVFSRPAIVTAAIY